MQCIVCLTILFGLFAKSSGITNFTSPFNCECGHYEYSFNVRKINDGGGGGGGGGP